MMIVIRLFWTNVLLRWTEYLTRHAPQYVELDLITRSFEEMR